MSTSRFLFLFFWLPMTVAVILGLLGLYGHPYIWNVL